MTIYVFAGPSVPRPVRERYAVRMTLLPPVAAGDLPRLRATAGDTVAIIDGYFQRRASVRHKEILDLLASGIPVHGAASMGALRAAELAPFGMTGHGRIFTDYHHGTITADDEVALVHGTEDEDYHLYTEALVNVRYALADAVGRRAIPRAVADQVLTAAGKTPFTERTRGSLQDVAGNCGIPAEHRPAVHAALNGFPDIKQVDAVGLLEHLAHRPAPLHTPQVPSWSLHETVFLRQWRAVARGTEEPGLGWVGEGEVHQMVQVLAVDYPSLRERVGVGALAAGYTPGAPVGPHRHPAAGHARPTRHRPDAGSVPPEVQRAAVRQLQMLGLVRPGALSDVGLDRWNTEAEHGLPEMARTCKAAARALFPPSTLAWGDPFLEELKESGAYPEIRKRLIECRRFNQELQRQRPAMQLAHLRAENILTHFEQRWDSRNLDEEALKRGFTTVSAFLASARAFYLYDKFHAHRPLHCHGSCSS